MVIFYMNKYGKSGVEMPTFSLWLSAKTFQFKVLAMKVYSNYRWNLYKIRLGSQQVKITRTVTLTRTKLKRMQSGFTATRLHQFKMSFLHRPDVFFTEYLT